MEINTNIKLYGLLLLSSLFFASKTHAMLVVTDQETHVAELLSSEQIQAVKEWAVAMIQASDKAKAAMAQTADELERRNIACVIEHAQGEIATLKETYSALCEPWEAIVVNPETSSEEKSAANAALKKLHQELQSKLDA